MRASYCRRNKLRYSVTCCLLVSSAELADAYEEAREAVRDAREESRRLVCRRTHLDQELRGLKKQKAEAESYQREKRLQVGFVLLDRRHVTVCRFSAVFYILKETRVRSHECGLFWVYAVLAPSR